MAGTFVFINYRRDDAAGHAGRIYDRLAQRFGEAQVFLDVDAIPGATDFTEEIRKALGRANAVVVVIGPHWLTPKGRSGKSRLQNSKDLVRAEIRTALRSNATVIPTLVGGAVMPDADQMPEDIAELHNRNAVVVSDRSFSTDVQKLIETIGYMNRHTAALPIAAEITPGHWELVAAAVGSSMSMVMHLRRDGSLTGRMGEFGGEATRMMAAAVGGLDQFGLGELYRSSMEGMTLEGRWRYDIASKALTLRYSVQTPLVGATPEEEWQLRIIGKERGVYQAVDQRLTRVSLKRIG